MITTVMVVLDAAQMELDAHVDDRHDDAAQVDHALDEVRRVGDARDAVVAADFLHLQDVDAVFLVAEREDEEFLPGRIALFGVAAACDRVRRGRIDHLDFSRHVCPQSVEWQS
jgi:hypothetical protein